MIRECINIILKMNKLFNQNSRTLINVVGVPLLLSSIYMGGLWFTGLIFFAIVVSTKEFSDLCKKNNIQIQLMWIYLFIVLIFLIHFIPSHLFKIDNTELLCLLVIMISLSEVFRFKDRPLENISCSLFSIIWIALFLNYIIFIRNIPEHGMMFTYVMFLSVWVCDTFAFFIGSKFGKKKILKAVSPNKTWLGTIAGFIASLLLNYILYFSGFYNFTSYNFTLFDVMIFGIIFGAIGQIGDFIESMIKRQANVKDSGTILKGHGGMFDRLDSMIIVSPCFYLYIKFFMGING